MSPGTSLGDRSPRNLKFKLNTHLHSVLSSIRNQRNHIKHGEGGTGGSDKTSPLGQYMGYLPRFYILETNLHPLQNRGDSAPFKLDS